MALVLNSVLIYSDQTLYLAEQEHVSKAEHSFFRYCMLMRLIPFTFHQFKLVGKVRIPESRKGQKLGDSHSHKEHKHQTTPQP